MNTSTAAPPLSASALQRRLRRNYIVGTGLALAAGALLFAFGLDLTPAQTLTLFFGLVPLAFVPTIALDVRVLNQHLAPILAALAGDPAASPAAAVVQALNLSYLTGRRVLTIHLPLFLGAITALVLAANSFFAFGLRLSQYINLALIAILVSTGHALFEYFAAQSAVRPILPWLWQTAGPLPPAQRSRLIAMGMRRKLLLVSLFAVLAPLAILGVTTLVRAQETLTSVGRAAGLTQTDVAQIMWPLQVWVAIVVALSIGVMVILAVVMARGVTRSADEIVAAMRKVQDGQLDAHLAVTTTDEFAELFEGFNLMTDGLHERERLRDAIGRYLAPALAEEVMKRGVRLGGQVVTATLLFADIRGFTTISEQLPPEAVVDLLNRYFAAVEPVLHAHGGWINKFGGDSLLAVFGAPVPQTDHARRAVQAALAMRAALAEFNQAQAAQGQPPLQIGIGLHCGDMLAGNVGSPARMEFTVIGDTVNVASRIDGLNKDWDTDILVSAEAWAAAGADFPARAMPPVALKGKSQLTQVYALE